MPRAFFIGQFDIHDPQGYAVYRSQTAATLTPFGGRFVVRGGRLEAFEGEAPAARRGDRVSELRSGEGLVRVRGLSEIDSDPPEAASGKVVPGRGRGGIAQTSQAPLAPPTLSPFRGRGRKSKGEAKASALSPRVPATNPAPACPNRRAAPRLGPAARRSSTRPKGSNSRIRSLSPVIASATILPADGGGVHAMAAEGGAVPDMGLQRPIWGMRWRA